MKASPIHARQGGFTLVEILIALAIFTFGGFAVVSTLMQSMQTAQRAVRNTEAAALAGQKIEILKNTPLSKIIVSETARVPEDLNTFPPEALSGWDGEEEYQGLETHQKYTLYWNVVPDFPTTGMASFRMEIQWEESRATRKMRFDFTKSQLF